MSPASFAFRGCHTVLDASGNCCKSGYLDDCGVCDGDSSSCGAQIEILIKAIDPCTSKKPKKKNSHFSLELNALRPNTNSNVVVCVILSINHLMFKLVELVHLINGVETLSLYLA